MKHALLLTDTERAIVVTSVTHIDDESVVKLLSQQPDASRRVVLDTTQLERIADAIISFVDPETLGGKAILFPERDGWHGAFLSLAHKIRLCTGKMCWC
jgi:hypothetical protein